MNATMTKTTNDPEILPCVFCGEPCVWGACDKAACAADALYLEEAHASPDGHREYADDLTGYAEHERDSADFGYGDARRCPRHPHVKTSSDDGMFDGVCGQCEYEGDMAEHEEEARLDAIRYPGGRCADAWKEPECGVPNASEDEIPF